MADAEIRQPKRIEQYQSILVDLVLVAQRTGCNAGCCSVRSSLQDSVFDDPDPAMSTTIYLPANRPASLRWEMRHAILMPSHIRISRNYQLRGDRGPVHPEERRDGRAEAVFRSSSRAILRCDKYHRREDRVGSGLCAPIPGPLACRTCVEASGMSVTVARIERVTHRYGSTFALNDLTLDIPGQCMVGMIGPDGVGKSTLLALISGVRKIQTGAVMVLGGNLADRHRRESYGQIAYLPQGWGAISIRHSAFTTISIFSGASSAKAQPSGASASTSF
jgi:hypothetical protein